MDYLKSCSKLLINSVFVFPILVSAGVSSGIGNDTISSLMVPAGFKVTVYENDDFTGDSLDCNSDDDALASDWQKMITSIIVEK